MHFCFIFTVREYHTENQIQHCTGINTKYLVNVRTEKLIWLLEREIKKRLINIKQKTALYGSCTHKRKSIFAGGFNDCQTEHTHCHIRVGINVCE